ncbi:DUF4214 domain-containing protein [Methylobacterium sp. P31]
MADLNATDNVSYVEQLYETVLGRHTDAGGLQAWTDTLAHGTSRTDVVDSFVFSAEHTAQLQPALSAGIFVPDPHAADVARLYYAELGRAPDAAGLQAWTSAIESGGTSLQDVAQGMLHSPEYASHTGILSDSALVEGLYQIALGRQADAAGLQAWTEALDSHAETRLDVVEVVVNSPEFQTHLSQLGDGHSNSEYVEALYEHVLGRQGDASGLQSWTAALDSNAESRIDLVHAFVNAPEFQTHLNQLAGEQSDTAFLESLYQNALGRQADAGGLQTWTDALAHGTARADVAVEIAESPEGQQHLGRFCRAGTSPEGDVALTRRVGRAKQVPLSSRAARTGRDAHRAGRRAPGTRRSKGASFAASAIPVFATRADRGAHAGRGHSGQSQRVKPANCTACQDRRPGQGDEERKIAPGGAAGCRARRASAASP